MNYQAFEWEQGDTLPSDLKEQILKGIHKERERCALILLFLFCFASCFLFLCTPFGNLGKFWGGTITIIPYLAIISVIHKRKIENVQCDNFVYRYGIVKHTSHGSKHTHGHTDVDGQRIPYIIGAKVGDTVLVVGFDTAYDSRRLATFKGFKI
jgi:hypothetical protein